MQLSNNGSNFDWLPCVQAVTDEHLAELATWRGCSLEFCNWLRDNQLIGRYSCGWAFPVGDAEGNLIGAHYLRGDPAKKDWRYSPGATAEPFVIGQIEGAVATHCFESQWDAFAFLDRSGDYLNKEVAVIITRGAANASRIAERIYSETELYVWPQNDSPGQNGNAPSEKWFKQIQSSARGDFYRVSIPPRHKDLNDWTRNGATKETVLLAIELATQIVAPGVAGAGELDLSIFEGPSIAQMAGRTINHENTLLGNRFLCRGCGMFFIAPSGQGKSSLTIQMAILWSACLAAFGIKPRKALRILIIQAEDDEGDQIEMTQMMKSLQLTDEEKELVKKNTRICEVKGLIGRSFIEKLERTLKAEKWDLIIINPFTSYLGGDPKDTELTTTFLQVLLDPILTKYGVAAIIIHHTPKTNFQNTDNYTVTDWLYWGAGNAGISNWARAYMVAKPIESDPGLYRFICAKRWQRIQMNGSEQYGWEGFDHYFCHATEPGVIRWDEPGTARIAKALAAKGTRIVDLDEVEKLIPLLDPEGKKTLEAKIMEKLSLPRQSMRDALKALQEQGRILDCSIPNPTGARSFRGWCRQSV
jgi:hypothetical protein